MATKAISNSPFFWRSWSALDKLKHHLGFKDQRLREIVETIQSLSIQTLAASIRSNGQQQKPQTQTLVPLAISFLGDYSDPQLESVLQSKIQNAKSEDVRVVLNDLILYAIENQNAKLIFACEKMIQGCPRDKIVDTDEGISDAFDGLNHYFPPFEEKKKQTPNSPWIHRMWNIMGTLRYAPFYVLNTVTMAYGIDMNEKPGSRWAAQSQITFYRTAYADFQWLDEHYLKLFSSRRKALFITASAVIALLTSYQIYGMLRKQYPEIFQALAEFIKSLMPGVFEKGQFRDFTEEARLGLIRPSVGKEKELEEIEACLSPTEDINPRAVILIGDAGVGKTNIVEALALKIVQNETTCLGKKILIGFNAVILRKKGTWTDSNKHKTATEELFEKIDGKEDEYILFIDEAHNLDAQTLETLKTKLLEKRLRVIFATTRKEFHATLGKQEPLLSRCRLIDNTSLDLRNTRTILQEIILKHNRRQPIPIDPEITKTIVGTTGKLDGAEPRRSKNFLEDLIARVHAFAPRKSSLIPFLKHKHQKISGDLAYKNKKDRSYFLKPEGKKDFDHLKLLESKIQLLEVHETRRIHIAQQRSSLLELITQIDKKLDALRQQMTAAKITSDREQLETRYLFLVSYACNSISKELEDLAKELKKGYPDVNLKELKDKGIITDFEIIQHPQRVEEPFETTITCPMIGEHAALMNKRQFQQASQRLGHSIKKEESFPHVSIERLPTAEQAQGAVDFSFASTHGSLPPPPQHVQSANRIGIEANEKDDPTGYQKGMIAKRHTTEGAMVPPPGSPRYNAPENGYPPATGKKSSSTSIDLPPVPGPLNTQSLLGAPGKGPSVGSPPASASAITGDVAN